MPHNEKLTPNPVVMSDDEAERAWGEINDFANWVERHPGEGMRVKRADGEPDYRARIEVGEIHRDGSQTAMHLGQTGISGSKVIDLTSRRF